MPNGTCLWDELIINNKWGHIRADSCQGGLNKDSSRLGSITPRNPTGLMIYPREGQTRHIWRLHITLSKAIP